MVARSDAQTPISNTNVTFLSGTGFFDWSQSILMDDITKNRIKFRKPSNAEEGVEIYNEDEIIKMVEEMKAN